ncbi:Flavin-binding monooxygenase-like family protein [Brugia pahangi]
MQSRFYCEVFAGHCKLRKTDVKRKSTNGKRFLKSQRHILVVYHDHITKKNSQNKAKYYFYSLKIDYVTHMDELAKMVGVKPNLMKLVH